MKKYYLAHFRKSNLVLLLLIIFSCNVDSSTSFKMGLPSQFKSKISKLKLIDETYEINYYENEIELIKNLCSGNIHAIAISAYTFFNFYKNSNPTTFENLLILARFTNNKAYVINYKGKNTNSKCYIVKNSAAEIFLPTSIQCKKSYISSEELVKKISTDYSSTFILNQNLILKIPRQQKIDLTYNTDGVYYMVRNDFYHLTEIEPLKLTIQQILKSTTPIYIENIAEITPLIDNFFSSETNEYKNNIIKSFN